jgi:hypothetical protein
MDDTPESMTPSAGLRALTGLTSDEDDGFAEFAAIAEVPFRGVRPWFNRADDVDSLIVDCRDYPEPSESLFRPIPVIELRSAPA